MHRLALALFAVLLLVTGVLAVPADPSVQADDRGPDKSPTTVLDSPVITAVVVDPGTQQPATPPVTVPIPCAWFGSTATGGYADKLNDVFGQIVGIIGSITGDPIRITLTFFSEDGRLHRWNDVGGQFERHQFADCSKATDPGTVTSGDTRWRAVAPPSPAILLTGTTEQATKPITTPTPTLSPASRAPVNLGMWLAVQAAGPISVRAELGPLWAETTATMLTTSFDLGTGEAPIVCAGHGTPIPNNKKDSIEQGPCGYTYSADTDGKPIDITITSTWTVTWTLSDATTGSEANIVVTAVLPYEVYEIQTVGSGG